MASRIGISTADLRRLRGVTDAAAHTDDGTSLPHSVLEALNDLVRCDQVTYEAFNPRTEEWVDLLDLYVESCDLSEDDFAEVFWPAFWSSPVCSYPQRTNDRTTVTRSSDFHTEREFRNTQIGELFRLQNARHNAMVPLATDGEIDHRIELWRADGGFTEREAMLLSLLRPHLAEFESAIRRRRTSQVLTARQIELLGLVAEGLTNRQICRRLDISEGTVRRHLENIYQRLEVTGRAAAVAYLATVRPS